MFVSVAILLLGLGALVRGRKLAVSRLFFVITFTAAGWLASFAAMYAAIDASTALTLGRLGFFFGAMVPAAVFHFATEVVGRRKQYGPSILLFWLACASVGVIGLTTDAVIAQASQ